MNFFKRGAMNTQNGCEILIVEDSPTQAITLKFLLEQEGYKVRSATNGREGVARALDIKPQLIISDIMMPEMDGFGLCKAVKNHASTQEIPVILLTTLTDLEDVIKGLNAKADFYVTKPYDAEFLLSKVRSVLDSVDAPQTKVKDNEIEVNFAGRAHVIKASRKQVLNLLLSTYENAVIQNRNLSLAKETLRNLNEQLEDNYKKLQISEEKFRVLVKTVPDIVYRVDVNGRFTFINDAVTRIGYTAEELIGEHFSRIILPADVTPVSREKVLKNMEGRHTGDGKAPLLFDERRTGKRKTTGLEIRLATKKGLNQKVAMAESIGDEVVFVEVNSSGMYEISNDFHDRNFIGTVGVIRDVSIRKAMEKGLQNAHNDLENKVFERTLELMESNKQLKQEIDRRIRIEEELEGLIQKHQESQAQLIQAEKIGALGVLTAGIAHELNNPMMGILNFAQYCLKHTDSEDRRYPVLVDTIREVTRCSDIVRNLLTFTRVDNPETEDYQEESLVTIMDRVFRLLAYRTEKENVRITRNIEMDTPSILMKTTGIQQVFLNLIGNALDSLKKSDEKKLHVQIRPVDGTVETVVTDTGKGIDPGILKKIFDPFYTTKPTGKGTGLGLSVSRSIVENHGGRITCESKKNKGAIFRVFLPIDGPEKCFLK